MGFHMVQLMGKDKPIWRLAFFSRLEERKGIKFFVDAINHLNVSHIPNFEVSTWGGGLWGGGGANLAGWGKT